MNIQAEKFETSLDRVGGAEIIRLAESARDALSDDIIARLAATLGEAMDLVDKINRSGVANALPVLSGMVANGDLERIAQIARLIGSAQDALSDDIVARLATLVGDCLDLVEKANRCGVGRLLELLEQQNLAHHLVACLDKAAADAHAAGPSRGGIGGLWDLMKQPETQDALRFFISFGKHFRNCQMAGKSD